MQRVVRKLLRAVAGYDPSYYDMHDDPNEAFFAQLYLQRILSHADAAGIRPPATVLEAGCQAGRLAVPLAKRGFRVTGIDTSAFALGRARRHLSDAGVAATLIRGDIAGVLRRRPHVQYDLAICAEVLYLSHQFRATLKALADAVRPGGLLCVSHRLKFYYLLEALRQYDVAVARTVARDSEGVLGAQGYFNWQTPAELRALYEGLGLRWLSSYPIDGAVWLSGVNPSQLSHEQRDRWLQLELELAEESGIGGRYLLVVAAVPERRR